MHDAEREDLVEIPDADRPLRVHPALAEADIVVPVTAAETVLNGGAAALLAAADPQALRTANAYSLLETSGSGGWRLALGLERALARRVALLGVSLTLNTPALGGVLHGYPHDRETVDRIANFPLRGLFGLVPGPVRRGVLRRLPSELSAAAVFAGPPSVAHAEALLRGVEAKATRLEERLDVICIGVPHTTAMLPREAPNPMSAAYLALGLALRLWRDEFPVNEGGTAILLSRFTKRFPHPTQQPFRALFQAARSSGARDPEDLAEAEQVAGSRRSRDRVLPRGPLVPPAAPVRRVVRLPARDRAARRRARRRVPGRDLRAPARVRARRTGSGLRSRWRTAARAAHRASATCCRPPYFPHSRRSPIG